MVNFREEEFELFDGKVDEAYILTYSLKNGYGFARTSDGRDVFVSSYRLNDRKEEPNLSFGSKIKFKYGIYNGKLCATEVELLEQFPAGQVIKIVSVEGQKHIFLVRDVAKIGVSDLLKNQKFLVKALAEEPIPDNFDELGFDTKDFKILFIETKEGDTYRFFDKDSRVMGQNGHVDVSREFSRIFNRFFPSVNENRESQEE